MSGPAQDLDAWDVALTHLAQARAQNPDTSPAAMVHPYYAMFHAARASLLRHGGSAPRKHDRVIQQFGLISKAGSAKERQAARDLNRAWDQRIEADYQNPAAVTSEMAQDCLAKAVSFLTVCADRFGFEVG
jgi:uncharacterized protein (UPF0332 family)